MGHTVFGAISLLPISPALDKPADVVFPVLHGQFGESGELQEILEQRGLPFVGSGSAASRLGMNKADTKKVWEKAGLPTPAYRIIDRGEKIGDIPGSCVVKAISSGSSIDVILCKAPAELPAQAADAIHELLARHASVLVEQYIDGPELTVGLLEEVPLAPIRIVPKSEFFDYNAKYKATDTEHRFDTGLPESKWSKSAANWLAEPTRWLGPEIWPASTSCWILLTIRICWRSTRCRGSRRRVCYPKRRHMRGFRLGCWWIGWRGELLTEPDRVGPVSCDRAGPCRSGNRKPGRHAPALFFGSNTCRAKCLPWRTTSHSAPTAHASTAATAPPLTARKTNSAIPS